MDEHGHGGAGTGYHGYGYGGYYHDGVAGVGYYEATGNGRGGSFRVGRDRRSWIGTPFALPAGEPGDEDEETVERRRGRGRCC